MKQPPQLILLDSNAYLRLAISIHPLLGQKFGQDKEENYVIRVIEKLDQEYAKNQRLRYKFHWVKDPSYVENRTLERLRIPPKQQKEVDLAVSFILGEEKRSEFSLSLVDAQALAVGFVKQCPVVSDDRGVQEIGGLLEIEVWSTLQLLKLMMNEQAINLDKCLEIAAYLDSENDLPCGRREFALEFKKFFGITPFTEK
ncbi:MAG TPA: hypothetical protein PLD51_06440 [Pontiellaceae bacterium]|nr:hypothetical protein [Pontiellaceae bacterium]